MKVTIASISVGWASSCFCHCVMHKKSVCLVAVCTVLEVCEFVCVSAVTQAEFG